MPQSTPPSFEPRRRNARVGVVELPAEGRRGETPPWPASGRTSKAVLECWAELWRTPQAVVWERLGWTREVARYCRLLVKAEQPGASATIHAQVTALADRLGLTPKSMRLLLWTVGPASPVDAEQVPAQADELEEARRRLRPSG